MPIINKASKRVYSKPWGYKRSVLLDNLELIEAIELVMKKSDATRLHYHEKVMEIFYIASGEFRFVINEENYHASEGDFIIIKPGERHKIIAETDGRIFIIKIPPDEEDRKFLE